MSPTIKLGLLALVGAAAAVPHNAGHAKFHHRANDAGAGYVGPTGGWGKNTTTPAAPTGTGYATGPAGDESTTDITTTSTIKSTITQTLYVTPVPASDATSVGAVDVSTGDAACGPATVTVTATNKVTVTVPAGGAASPSEGAPAPYVPEVPSESSAIVVEKGHHRPTHGKAPPAYPTGPAPTKPAPVPTKESSAYVAPAPSSAQESSAYVAPSSSSAKESPAPVKPTSEAPSASQPAKTSEYASATPSSKPSNTPSIPSGGKRGLVYTYADGEVAKGFAEKGSFGFFHDWEATPREGPSENFIPTMRSLERVADWDAAFEECAAAGSKTAFTWNEPDRPDQANMAVGAACDAWKKHVAPLMTKYPQINFVGPSVSSSHEPNQGLEWLTQFMEQCSEAVWDTANVHWYGKPSDGFKAFKDHIDQVSSTIKKPFYVSEFGLTEASGEQSAAFLEEALPYLESKSDCVGYSYFVAGTTPTGGMKAEQLLGDANALTQVGKVYMGIA